MKAAYLEATGGPEVIRYGDLPTPEPEARARCWSRSPPRRSTRSTPTSAPAWSTMPLPKPFIIGCDLAGTVEAVGPRRQALQGRRPRLGLATRDCSAGRARSPSTPRRRRLALSDARRRDRPGRGRRRARRHHRPPRPVPLRRSCKPGETVFVNGGTGGVGSMVVQMAKAVGAKVDHHRRHAPRRRSCAASWGADRVLNYKTDDVAGRRPRVHRRQGRQRLVRDAARAELRQRRSPLLAPRGRMILMAGRQAQPVVPGRPVLRQGPVAVRLRHVQRHAGRAARLRRRHQPLAGREASCTRRSAARSRWPRPPRRTSLLEENTLHKAGTLTGKIVLVP